MYFEKSFPESASSVPFYRQYLPNKGIVVYPKWAVSVSGAIVLQSSGVTPKGFPVAPAQSTGSSGDNGQLLAQTGVKTISSLKVSRLNTN